MEKSIKCLLGTFSLRRPQNVIFQRPEDTDRGRPPDVGRLRPLALHKGPYGDVYRMSFRDEILHSGTLPHLCLSLITFLKIRNNCRRELFYG